MITLIITLSIIVALIAIVIGCAPFSITIRTSRTISYEFQFGDCMPYVWACAYWFVIMRHTETPEDNEYPNYSEMLFTFWEMNSGKYINGKTTPDEPEDNQVEIYTCPDCKMNLADCYCHDEEQDHCPECGSTGNCDCYYLAQRAN